MARFFVTLTVSATFVATIGLELWPIIAGLILGGALAPRRLPPTSRAACPTGR